MTSLGSAGDDTKEYRTSLHTNMRRQILATFFGMLATILGINSDDTTEYRTTDQPTTKTRRQILATSLENTGNYSLEYWRLFFGILATTLWNTGDYTREYQPSPHNFLS